MSTVPSRLRLRPLWVMYGVLLAGGVTAGVYWWAAPRKPNLLLITLDTTRADRLGCYGYAAARTPTLDALAKSGVKFERAFATAPLTLPSHATMMTGLYPPEHGLRTNGKGRLHQDVPTLARSLRQAGYRTGAFVGAFVLDSKFGLEQGFQTYDDDFSGTRRTEDPLHRERSGGAVVDRALDWLTGNAHRSFFCWVHLYDPHFPYQPHTAEFGEDFQERPYDGELASVDRQVRRLTEFLQSRKRAENTLIVVVGDHGEGLGDHQETMHGYMLYNSTLHVPWFASWPGRVPAGVSVAEPVSLVDLLPTVLDTLEIPLPPKITGRSLVPAFSGRPITPSVCYAETDDPRLDNGWSGLQMLLTPEWKYIRTAKPELFRLENDAREQRNLAGEAADELQTLDQQLSDLLSGLTPRGTDIAALSSRDKRALAGLGYTAGQSATTTATDTEAPDIKDMVVHFNRVMTAMHLMEEDKAGEAESLLRETVAAAPEYTAAWGNLGRCLVQQGRFDEALECYRRILERHPEDVSALLNQATARLAQGRPKEATKPLERLLEIDPENADAYFYLARANLQDKNVGDAYAHFTRALACDPEHVEAMRGLADLLFERGQLEMALEHYAGAIRLDPYAPGPYVNRGICLGRMNRLDNAVACFTDGLKFSPDDPLLHSNLGFACQNLGRYAEAVKHYSEALSTAPNEPQALVNLPWLLSTVRDDQLRDGPRAVRLAQQAVEASQGASLEAYDALAAAYAEVGRFDEAVKTIDSARRAAVGNRQLLQNLTEHADAYRSLRPYRLAR